MSARKLGVSDWPGVGTGGEVRDIMTRSEEATRTRSAGGLWAVLAGAVLSMALHGTDGRVALVRRASRIGGVLIFEYAVFEW